MDPISRRHFLTTAALTLAATQLRADAAPIALELSANASGPHMSEDFVGLSYEVQQLTDPDFFSAKNTGLIAQCRALAGRGVLRLGGNTSEFAWWKPSSSTPEPEHPKTRVVEGEPKPQYYAVTPEAVRNLAGFLDATGWTCLYGIGMGTNTPERAADEAAFVARTLGSRLQYFQVGNEADLYSNHLRDPQTWSAKMYLDEWLAIARAISARVPNAIFGMPDVAFRVEWLTQVADLWASVKNPPHVTTLSHHYYFGGPATNPEVNIANLLKPATMAKVQQTADAATSAAGRMGARVRMTEGNTCYRGGKPGVSDVFAAALWAADYALLLASNNYSGVNLHGGTGKSVANSVGGTLPGDALLAQQGQTPAEIASHPHPFYTPIATFGSEYTLEPVAYGLKFAGLLSGAILYNGTLTEKLKASGVNATGYAGRLSGGAVRVVLLNKDAMRDLDVRLRLAMPGEPTDVVALRAPALDSRSAEIVPIASVGRREAGDYRLTLPKASGLCLTFGKNT